MNTINQYKSTPTFGSYYKSSFSKHLEHTLRTNEGADKVIQEFNQILKSKKNISSKIGQGSYGEVYRIDDFYVFKSYFSQNPKPNSFTPNTDNTFNNLKTYFGKVIARIGNIEIIRNVTKNTKNFHQMANVQKEGINAFNQALEEFATLPQQAFDRLAQDFDKLNKLKHGHIFFRFDTNNPNNFIKVGQSIRIVDDIDWTPCEKANTFYALLRIFAQKNGNASLKKELFKKCVLACEKYQLPLDTDYKYLKKYVEELFTNANIKTSFEQHYQKMTELRNTQKDKNIRMEMVKQYLDTL